MAEELPTSLQESLLALLAFNRAGGATVAAQVLPEHFDAPYQEIATQLLDYWRQYSRPPGPAHLDDIFGLTLQTGERATRLRRLLVGITGLASGINADYLVRRVSDHIRAQTLKAGVLRAGELYQGGGADNIAQVEQVLYDALRSSTSKMDAGTFLDDQDRSLRFLNYRPTTYDIGIPELDRLGIGATARELLLYIGPKGSGKSWFCVHMGRQCLKERGRVVHISLEMDEEWVIARYLQSIFSAAWRRDPYVVSMFELDELKRLTGWKVRSRRPKFSFTDPDIRTVLRSNMAAWGARLGSIVVKRFPTGSLTVPQLIAYLDYLEAVEGFIPNMLIVDYPGLMKLDSRHIRTDLGRTVVDLRGLAVKRDLALVAPAQGQRKSMEARRVRASQAGEDISMVYTADTSVTYSQTRAEKRLGLARFAVEYTRNQQGDQEFVISQAYAAGQYLLDSTRINTVYWDKLKLEEDQDGEDDDSEGE